MFCTDCLKRVLYKRTDVVHAQDVAWQKQQEELKINIVQINKQSERETERFTERDREI